MINLKDNHQNYNRHSATTKIMYEDVDHHNKLVGRQVISGLVGDPIDRKTYKQKVPSGYKFVDYGNFANNLQNGGEDVIYVKKDSKDSDHYEAISRVIIDYVDTHNQLIGRRSFTGQVGNTFQLRKYMKTAPVNYHFKQLLVGHNITKFNRETQIAVAEMVKNKRSDIIIKYLYQNYLLNKIVVKNKNGAAFKLAPYLKQIPAHYQFVKIIGKVPKVFGDDQKIVLIDVKPNKIKHSKSAKSATKNMSKPGSQDRNKAALGSILVRIGSSLDSLGKVIQSEDRNN